MPTKEQERKASLDFALKLLELREVDKKRITENLSESTEELIEAAKKIEEYIGTPAK